MTKKENFNFFISKPDLMLQQFNGLKSILQFHFMPLTNDLLNLLPNIVKLIGERRLELVDWNECVEKDVDEIKSPILVIFELL